MASSSCTDCGMQLTGFNTLFFCPRCEKNGAPEKEVDSNNYYTYLTCKAKGNEISLTTNQAIFTSLELLKLHVKQVAIFHGWFGNRVKTTVPVYIYAWAQNYKTFKQKWLKEKHPSENFQRMTSDIIGLPVNFVTEYTP